MSLSLSLVVGRPTETHSRAVENHKWSLELRLFNRGKVHARHPEVHLIVDPVGAVDWSRDPATRFRVRKDTTADGKTRILVEPDECDVVLFGGSDRVIALASVVPSGSPLGFSVRAFLYSLDTPGIEATGAFAYPNDRAEHYAAAMAKCRLDLPSKRASRR